VAADTDLLGKVIGDLQKSDVKVNGKDSVTGTLKYVSDYTGFSGDTEEQQGHYLVLHATHPTADSIKAKLHGGVHDEVTLDSDGILITRITDPKKQTLVFTAVKGENEACVTLSLKDLVLEPEA